MEKTFRGCTTQGARLQHFRGPPRAHQLPPDHRLGPRDIPSATTVTFSPMILFSPVEAEPTLALDARCNTPGTVGAEAIGGDSPSVCTPDAGGTRSSAGRPAVTMPSKSFSPLICCHRNPREYWNCMQGTEQKSKSAFRHKKKRRSEKPKDQHAHRPSENGVETQANGSYLMCVSTNFAK